jgi:hypothetical protein
MDISRDNYESWFLDYFDGHLDAGQIEMLMSFLEFNPDLKEELESMEMMQVKPGEMEYDLKASLRKPLERPDPGSIAENFEDYCISSMEKQTSQAEESMIQEIMENDPDKKALHGLYSSLVLEADENIRFPLKSRLKRRFTDIPAVRLIAGAAAAIILMTLPWLFRTPADRVISSEDHMGPVLEEAQGQKTPAGQSEQLQQTFPAYENSEPAGTPGIINDELSAPDPDPDIRDALAVSTFTMNGPAPERISLARIESLEVENLESRRSPENTMTLLPSPVVDTQSNMDVEGFIRKRFGSRQKGADADNKDLFWRMADAGIEKLNQVSEEDYTLAREKDDTGRVLRFKFETPNFGISAPRRNPGEPAQ